MTALTLAQQALLLLADQNFSARARAIVAQSGAYGVFGQSFMAAQLALQSSTLYQERRRNILELLLLEALAYHQKRSESEALNKLADALRLAEPEGFIRTFIDEGEPMATLLAALRERERKIGPTPYLDGLLAAFVQEGTAVKASQPSLPDRISPREREVLHLLARGASNQEIADALVVTVETVKRHVSSLLAKLGVDNRTQAAMRARALGLYSENP